MGNEIKNDGLRHVVGNLKSLPDPERAHKNIDTFLQENPEHEEFLFNCINEIALLFSYSQFLANYCIQNPSSLIRALPDAGKPLNLNSLKSDARLILKDCLSVEDGMRAVRRFKKDKLLLITLRDVLRKADFAHIMEDLSILADAIITESLLFIESSLHERFGTPEDNAFAVMALGKLGAHELNYSSDVDLIFVYRHEGETSGVSSMQGVVRNRISAFQYYCKLAEELSRFLSANTEDGFAYRVDLRLRPQGQRGSLALSLRGYEEYYESWGQLWERAALLRTRQVAGDMNLGEEFLSAIKPFVYRRYLDFEAISEIRRMKSQVEHLKPGTFSSDIKRGYGGIREIEFFIQVFQLIYGGKETLVREKSTLRALHRLLQKGLIGYEDYRQLSRDYLFLRLLEHRLQQLHDLQTHLLPANEYELDIIGRKMGFADKAGFLAELNSKRLAVREIYDTLLQSADQAAGSEQQDACVFDPLSSMYWDVDTPLEHLLKTELSKTMLKDIDKAIHYLTKIRNTLYSFQTIRGRRLLERLIPHFIDEALKGPNPDLALLQLVDFSSILAARESYLEALAQQPEFISSLSFVFSRSEYLSRILMSNPIYVDSLVEGDLRRKRKSLISHELVMLAERYGQPTAVRLLRRLKEIQLGLLFLNKKISVQGLTKSICEVAETIFISLMGQHCKTLTIICYGKLGGREIIFNSDLDIVFITAEEPTFAEIRAAEHLLKSLMAYTKNGIAYKIDTRLRPEGSKGPLVNSIAGTAEYYAKNAHAWELQALLKARPLLTDKKTARHFLDMRTSVLMQRGREITHNEMKRMRERIQRELSREGKEHFVQADRESSSAAFCDIKLGAGGIEEVEFSVQYLQLKHCAQAPDILVQGTLDAVKRLNKAGFLRDADAANLADTYVLYRTIEIMLRLRNETILKQNSDIFEGIAHFLKQRPLELSERLCERREWVRTFWDKLQNAY